MSHYPRPELAREFAEALTDPRGASSARSGLFLASPRRTGKTEFLKDDLRPEMERRGYLVLYTDLWADKRKSPMDLIAATITAAVQETLGLVAKAAKGTGLDKVGIPGAFSVDLSRIGKTDGMSLYDALRHLHKQSRKPILLIIDEAQHALVNEDGDNALSALKSARDQMREDGRANLLIVMSGSHRDKLMRLLNSPAAPFWGAQVRALPLLDDGYVAREARGLRERLPHLATVRQSVLVEAFEHTGRRPEFFIQQLDAASDAVDAAAFEDRLQAAVRGFQQLERKRHTDTYHRLPSLEQAVLQRLLEQGERFRPFDAPALDFYAKVLGKKTVSAAQVQNALEALRDNEPPMVWKSMRGEYAAYDQELIAWHAYLVGEKNWPPKK